MNQFSIKDIEVLSGIKAQTLRVWEQRYGILVPKRKLSKHRIYDDNDLKSILCVAHLNQRGYKISRIARMTAQEINELTLATGVNKEQYEEIIMEYIDAIKDFDDIKFNRIFNTNLNQLDFEKIVVDIFYPLLQRLGQCWITDQIKPAQEHFASEIIASKIDFHIQTLKKVNTGPLILLFLPRGEFHRIPLLFISYLLRKYGKRAVFLGADVDIETLEQYLSKNVVDILHMHLITEFFDDQPERFVKRLLTVCKKQKIIISGPAGANIHLTNPRLTTLSSMQALIHYCKA
ncbi:MAG: MerR family transcriptional regulator [Bacteroidota bacterium]